MTTPLFIAGSHTDIGKTHVACALIRAGRAAGLRVEALKPVASGFDADDWAGSDPGRLLDALGVAPTPETLEHITPWRFAAPLAPPMAARLEGRDLKLSAVAGLCAARLETTRADLFVLEGVGGLMSPLTDDATGLELMQRLGLPTVLVGGGYLGAMSHTLTALEVLRARGQAVAAVVVSQDADPAAPDFPETVAMIAAYAGDIPVIAAPRAGAAATPTADWATRLLKAVAQTPMSAPA